MNLIHRTITILGITTILGGIPLAAFAQPPQSLVSRTNVEDFFYRGVDKVERGNYQGAMVNFDQALRLKPNFAEAYYNRGLARSHLRNLQGAIADHNQVIRINPSLAEAHGNRGLIRYRLGNQRGAIADLQKAAQLFSDRGNKAGYQQTLAVIQMMQQSPTPKASMPPCPELF